MVPETIQQLAKRLSQISDILLRGGDDSTEWRTLLAQTDEFLSPPTAKVLDVLSRYEPGSGDAHTFDPYGTGYQARLVRAKNAFLAACEGESPQIRSPFQTVAAPVSAIALATRYESPAQVRPMSPIISRTMSPGPTLLSNAPNVASIPPPRMVSGSGAGAVVTAAPLPVQTATTTSPAPVQYFRSLVSPLVKKRSMSPPRDIKPPVPSPVLPVSPAPIIGIDYVNRITSSGSGSCFIEPVLTAPVIRTSGISPINSQSGPQMVAMVPIAPVDSSFDTISPILAKANLQQYVPDFLTSDITTSSKFYKQTGKDLQVMNLPTEVQTTVLTLIRDYWIEKASAHRT